MNESCSHYYSYSYDPVGNRTKLETKKSTTSYSYDQADELTSASKLEHRRTEVTSYAYDLNGNETQEGSTHYSYNLENKLAQVVDKHEKVSYSYTGEGLMNTRSTHSETTSYSWDTSSELPELALETTSKGQGRHVDTDTTAYTYGAGPIGTETRRGSYTFHTDALGSVIALSDEHGKLVEAYRYTPYGESYGPGASDEAPAETSENPIRFTGQYLDSESGLYNMRAREYDPETGRFLETDPVTCDEGGACGSVYVYVDDRPTVKTDPSGMCPIDNGTPTCMKNWWKNSAQEKSAQAVLSSITNRHRQHAWNEDGKIDPLWKEYAMYAPLPPLRIRALDEAKSWLGTTESPADSNHVHGITDWYGLDHAYWCVMAVTRWYVDVGSTAFEKGSRWSYAGDVSKAAKEGWYGLSVVKRSKLPQPGDIVTFSEWGEPDASMDPYSMSYLELRQPADHIGIVVDAASRNVFNTIEGNTSSSSSGSQSNGGGVFKKHRVIPDSSFAHCLFIHVSH
jgi:RHS repeat-associated protein